jgi:homoserine acetyltransferase
MVLIQAPLKIIEFYSKRYCSIFIEGLRVNKLFALIGGSVGGGIAWEILVRAKLAQNFIPIADWKATDWLIANCYLQEQI